MSKYDYSDCVLSRYERWLLSKISNLKKDDPDFISNYENQRETTALQRLSDFGLICAINGERLDMDHPLQIAYVVVPTLKGKSYKIYRRREVLVTYYPLVVSSLSFAISFIAMLLTILK